MAKQSANVYIEMDVPDDQPIHKTAEELEKEIWSIATTFVSVRKARVTYIETNNAR
jgi:hypothetical protein